MRIMWGGDEPIDKTAGSADRGRANGRIPRGAWYPEKGKKLRVVQLIPCKTGFCERKEKGTKSCLSAGAGGCWGNERGSNPQTGSSGDHDKKEEKISGGLRPRTQF